MKYLKRFKIHSDYEEYINGKAVLPNVSYTEDTLKVYYNPIQHDYSQDYFTMVVTVGGDVAWAGGENNALYYSKDNGKTWSEPSDGITISVNKGDKVLWKGETSPKQYYGIGTFSGSTDVRYTVEGNVMSLLFGDDFKGQTSLEGKNYVFQSFFYNNKNIINAENLSLPATTLAENCYNSMFYGCTSLVNAPELPATTLANSCYSSMFTDCTSLVTAPELPATTLARFCYNAMFSGCTSLTTAPELPATTLAGGCYQNMFKKCTSLVTTPELPVTTLASACYGNMFSGCTSLTTAPELPATTLVYNCYSGMFSDCTSLTTAPELPATTLAEYCYNGMFSGCTELNYIKCLATDISATDCTSNWVKNVASTGTFVKASSMTSWSTGTSGIPTGWTVVDA